MTAEITPPDVLHFDPEHLALPDLNDRVGSALKAYAEVWFPLLPGDGRPFFSLRSERGSIQVRGGDGRHLGTFASVGAAMSCGWERGGEGHALSAV